MSTLRKKVLIRCDAAAEIGFGHVVRCLALADELRIKHGFKVEFAMLQGAQGALQVKTQGYEVYQPVGGVKVSDEGCWLRRLITQHQHQVLILDVRTDLATEAVQYIRDVGVLVVIIDDSSERRLHADLVFYPPVPQMERLDWSGFTGRRYVGWDWVLLRPQFAQAALRIRALSAKLVTKSSKADRCLTLLITMGGSDPAGLTLMALDAIEQLDCDLRVLVIVGSGFLNNSALAEWVTSSKRNYEVFHDVTDMASLMAEADLAVASFGVTAYELAVMGVPAIYVSLTQDHEESAELFAKSGIAINIGRYDKIDATKLAAKLTDLLTNDEQRGAFSKRARRLVAGFGVSRIAALIASQEMFPATQER